MAGKQQPTADLAAPQGFRFGGTANFAFAVSVSKYGSVATLELSGEFDLASSDRFDIHLQHLLAGNPDHVVIDLRSLSFIDSSGLRHLVRAHALSGREGFDLWIVCGDDDQIRQTLDVSGFTKAVPLVAEPPDLRY